MRRSCDTEVSMAERSRSRSAPRRAWSISSARVSRSMATAAWLPTASSSRRSRGAELVARLQRQHADHADPGAAGADRHEQPAPAGQGVGAPTRRMVGIPRPARRGEVGVAELAVGWKGGPRGELAIPGVLLRHQDHDLGAQQPGKMGDHDPQQIVELDDARDLAAEGVELGGRTRLAPRRFGLRARARGERAGGDGHEHEETSATALAGSAMVNS